MLSGHYWPVHLKPLEDEALASWIGRLAASQGLTLRTFCALVFPGRRLTRTDVDLSVAEPVLVTLARQSGVPVDRVRATTLATYAGRLYLKGMGHSTPPWILPVGVYTRGPSAQALGLPYCAACLAEDRSPYFRRAWRLAFHTLCPTHGTLLGECCPVCQAAVDIWKASGRAWAQEFAVGHCSYCRSPLADAAAAEHPFGGRHVNLQRHFQTLLHKVATHGYRVVPGYGAVYAHLYFEGLHRIVDLFTKGRGARQRRAALARHPDHGHLRPVHKRLQGPLERLPVRARHGLMRSLAWFMADWPARFVAFCAAHRIPTTAMYADRRTVPFWYRHMTHP